ncbi:hypothetical protein [Alkalihalobacillus sp. LMS39]|nr:hypothetical protein [Alkalihalobacillus sp. LMS39]UOE95596.1 hypothetical protein MM271_08315 [Alkalihalobacillus sp. LMS39]
MKENALEIAKKIVNLDAIRDQLLEDLILLSGNDAHEIVRRVQNGML